MIVDLLSHAASYRGIHPGIQRALEFLATDECKALRPGRYEIDGKELVAIVEEYLTKLAPQAVWESHRRHVDVQYVASGTEAFGVANSLDALPVKMPYSEERDVTFYEPGNQRLVVTAGTFLVFFPQDIHAPGLAVSEPSPVRKVVMKVRGDW